VSDGDDRSAGITGDPVASQPQQPQQERPPAGESEQPGRPADGRQRGDSEQPGQPAHRRRLRLGWRGPVATVLIVIGCILAPVSVIAVWTANQVSDTGRYIANIEPLIHEPAVQNALTDKVSTAITSHLNVNGVTGQAVTLLQDKGLGRLGGLLKSFSPSITGAVDGYIHSTVHKVVTGPRFAHTWVQVNTVAHQTLVNVLSGRGTTVKVVNDQVTIDLAPFINIVKQDLASRGFTLINKLPPIHLQLALFSAKDLSKAQTLYRLINDLKIVLPILALVLIGLGVLVARRHRRALIGAGLGFAASMLVLGAALLIARTIYLNSVPPSTLPTDAASVLFDTFVRFIKTALRTLLVVGLVVAAAAFLSGPSATAVKTRGAFRSGFTWIRGRGERHGMSTGPVGEWTYSHRHALRIAAVGLFALIFVFWGHPTAAVVILLVVLLLVVLALIELIGRPPAPTAPAETPSQP
jgi:hypothetical protein